MTNLKKLEEKELLINSNKDTEYKRGDTTNMVSTNSGPSNDEPIRIVINIIGGVLQGAYSNQPVEIIVLDYDNSIDDTYVTINGEKVDATFDPAKIDKEFIGNVFNEFNNLYLSDL